MFCNNLQNAVAITYIFVLQFSAFGFCNFLHFYFTINKTEIYWERRLELFQERYGNQFVSSYNAPYILTSVGANFLFAIQYRELETPVCGISYTGWIVISIVILLCFLLYIISQENAAEIKRTYIKQWIEIKENTDIGDLEGWRMALRARLGKKETEL